MGVILRMFFAFLAVSLLSTVLTLPVEDEKKETTLPQAVVEQTKSSSEPQLIQERQQPINEEELNKVSEKVAADPQPTPQLEQKLFVSGEEKPAAGQENQDLQPRAFDDVPETDPTGLSPSSESGTDLDTANTFWGGYGGYGGWGGYYRRPYYWGGGGWRRGWGGWGGRAYPGWGWGHGWGHGYWG